MGLILFILLIAAGPIGWAILLVLALMCSSDADENEQHFEKEDPEKSESEQSRRGNW